MIQERDERGSFPGVLGGDQVGIQHSDKQVVFWDLLESHWGNRLMMKGGAALALHFSGDRVQ